LNDIQSLTSFNVVWVGLDDNGQSALIHGGNILPPFIGIGILLILWSFIIDFQGPSARGAVQIFLGHPIDEKTKQNQERAGGPTNASMRILILRKIKK
jgi:hypothetical protein